MRHLRIAVGLAVAAGLISVLALTASAQYREYNISGRVVDSQKNPLAGVDIILRDQATSRSLVLKTKKDGSFKYVGLPHGLYQVVFRKEGFAEKTDEWKFQAPQDQMLKVEIPPVVMVSQEVLAEAEKMQKAAAERQGGGRKGPCRRLRRRRRGARAHPREEPQGLQRPLHPGHGPPEERASSTRPSRLSSRSASSLPASPPSTTSWGSATSRRARPTQALASYAKAMELDPANPDGAYNSGLILFAKSQAAEALALFEKALVLEAGRPGLPGDGRPVPHQPRRGPQAGRGDRDRQIVFRESPRLSREGQDRVRGRPGQDQIHRRAHRPGQGTAQEITIPGP